MHISTYWGTDQQHHKPVSVHTRMHSSSTSAHMPPAALSPSTAPQPPPSPPLTGLPLSSRDEGFSTTTVWVGGLRCEGCCCCCAEPLLLGQLLACVACVTWWHSEHLTDCAPLGNMSMVLQPPQLRWPYTGTWGQQQGQAVGAWTNSQGAQRAYCSEAGDGDSPWYCLDTASHTAQASSGKVLLRPTVHLTSSVKLTIRPQFRMPQLI